VLDTDIAHADPIAAIGPPALSPPIRGQAGRVRVALGWLLVGAGIIGAVLPAVPGLLRTLAAVIAVYVALRLVVASVGRRRGVRVDLGAWLAGTWLGLLATASALASVLPLAEGRDPSRALTEPVFEAPDLLSRHPFGTDLFGLDVLSQLLYGARVSLTVAVGAIVIAIVVGGTVGMLAGFLRGWVDAIVSFLTDTLLAFPALILLLALAAILSPSVLNITIALGVLAVPGTVRLARAATISISSREFVTASRALGATAPKIILRDIAPNVLPPLIAYSFVTVGFLIVAEASLSFLGLSIKRPNPTWGNVIYQGQSELTTHPYLVLLPALFLFLTVTSASYIGQRLQRKWAI
jgi:peptide/nickel transport system permease protein